MEKTELIEVLKKHGVELEETAQKELLNDIYALNGKDITKAKADYEKLKNDNAELLKYKDYESELNSLREFKTNTEKAQADSLRNENLEKLISEKFDKKAVKLLVLAAKEKAVFGDDNTITNSEDLLNNLTAEYSDYIVKETVEGAEPVNNAQTQEKQEPIDPFLQGLKGK